MISFIIVACIWIVCGAFAYAGILAYQQREYSLYAQAHRRDDLKDALVIGSFGPVGLLSILLDEGFKHGLMWRLPKEGS